MEPHVDDGEFPCVRAAQSERRLLVVTAATVLSQLIPRLCSTEPSAGGHQRSSALLFIICSDCSPPVNTSSARGAF